MSVRRASKTRSAKPNKTSAGAMLRRQVVMTKKPAHAGPGWRAMGEHYTQLCEYRSDRYDLTVFVAPGATQFAADEGFNRDAPPGYYLPTHARIALDGDLIPVSPEQLDTTDPEHFKALSTLQGVFVHELGHAMHSDSIRPAWESKYHDVVRLLEEIRMEARTCEDREDNHKWLRASASNLIVAENSGKTPSNKSEAASLAVLVVGRLYAGSLTDTDVADVDAVLATIFDPAEHAELHSILKDTCAVADGDCDALIDCARRLIDLCQEDGDGDGDGEGEGAGGEGDGEGSEGSGKADSAGKGKGKGKGKASGSDDVEDGSGSGSGDEDSDGDGEGGSGSASGDEDSDSEDEDGSGSGEDGEDSDGENPWEKLSEAVAKAAADAQEQAAEELQADAAGEDVEDVADAAREDARNTARGDLDDADAELTDNHDSDDGGSHGRGRRSSRVTFGPREPQTPERHQRNKLAKILRRARWRDRDSITVSSIVPPGRLRAREAMRGSAERSMGRAVSAKPFKQTKRRTVEQPKLKVAVLCDVSGSMGGVVGAVSSAMWVVANAVNDCEGKMVGVAFGDEARIVVEPGKAPKRVLDFPANGGMESIGSAMQLADEQLDLSNPMGPRLVIIVSDGYWTSDREATLANDEMRRVQATGAKIIQVNLGSEPIDHGADQIVTLTDAEQMADLIGNACVTALKNH